MIKKNNKGATQARRTIGTNRILVLALVVSAVLVLFPNIRTTALNWIMSFFGNSSFMLFTIGALVAIGLVLSIRSFLRMGSEIKLLRSEQVQRHYNPLHRTDHELRACLNYLKNENKSQSLLEQRLESIFSSININSNTNRGDRVLPHLNAMHDISLHRELSKLDSALVSAILSFLLVMGILGTLTGVHDVLKEQEINLRDLADALLPSACAVFGTIFLMIGRAFYMNRVMYCLAMLDELTMQVILPVLTRGAKEVSLNELDQAINDLPELIEQEEKYNSRLEDFVEINRRVDELLKTKAEESKPLAPYKQTNKNDVTSLLAATPPPLNCKCHTDFERHLQNGQDIITELWYIEKNK